MPSLSSRLTATAALIGLSASLLVACGSNSGANGGGLLAAIESGNVTLGTKYDQPGLGLREPDGTMTGLDVDIAQYVVNAIAEDNGWNAPTVEWKETPSVQRETLLQNGDVDLIAATYSINSTRAESIDFAGPYLTTHQALLVQEHNTSVQGLNDLDGKILCSVTGSTPAQTLKEELPSVDLQEYDTYSSCSEALRQGKVDAMTTDATILNGYAMQSPGTFRVVELERDGEPFSVEHYGIGLTKGDTDGTDAVNAALDTMLSDGTFDQLVEKNLGDGEAIEPGSPGDMSFLDN